MVGRWWGDCVHVALPPNDSARRAVSSDARYGGGCPTSTCSPPRPPAEAAARLWPCCEGAWLWPCCEGAWLWPCGGAWALSAGERGEAASGRERLCITALSAERPRASGVTAAARAPPSGVTAAARAPPECESAGGCAGGSAASVRTTRSFELSSRAAPLGGASVDEKARDAAACAREARALRCAS